MLAKAKLGSSITFIVLASFTIVTYDRQNMFIIKATDDCTIHKYNLLCFKPPLFILPNAECTSF